MTIEDGSSLSQSKTHLEVFENLVESDCTMLRDIVNNQLIPRMVKHGFPIKGCASNGMMLSITHQSSRWHTRPWLPTATKWTRPTLQRNTVCL